MTRSLRHADYEALARFRYAIRKFERFSEHAARAEGLTPSQHQLLLAVRGHPPGSEPSISTVAELLQQQHHSVVELVDRAVDGGLVERRQDSTDRRRVLLRLTRRGDQVLERLSESHRDELRRSRDQLTGLLAALD